jgi:diacylglycerol kinase
MSSPGTCFPDITQGRLLKTLHSDTDITRFTGMGRTVREDGKRNFSFVERLRSFRAAFHGIATLLRYEHNARIHLFVLLIVIVAGILFHISMTEWLAILFVSGLVFASECFNTAVEYLSDLITDRQNENIRRAKDVAAAGVLISAGISVATGLIIFVPEIIKLIRGRLI